MMETWPNQISFTFFAPSDFAIAPAWTRNATKKAPCSDAAECIYSLEIPCNAAVGPGLVRAIFENNGAAILPYTFYVLFNPFAPEEEVYMNFTQEGISEYLHESITGIWRGSWQSNGPMSWDVDQFDATVMQAAMRMVARIPLFQRDQATRVSRWLTYLIGSEVLWGNWCEEEGCMDDGALPSSWSGSKAIFAEWLASRTQVKYAQCWVFAGVLVSATRSLGFGSRVVSTFNSAHGRPPYNKGIDDFFYYDEELRPTMEHVNKKESIWNFHVWNEVWMQRRDLSKELDADGWQIIDATPQEESCEQRGSQYLCRYMLGPMPKTPLYNRRMETEGGETMYNSVFAGLSYDSMFVFGEVDGDWRGWQPASRSWSSCSNVTCPHDYRGDGYCDSECNVPECDFDMGDCCAESCNAPVGGVTLHRKYQCGYGPYDCKGEAKGWEAYYNNTWYVGCSIQTHAPGYPYYYGNEIVSTYKKGY